MFFQVSLVLNWDYIERPVYKSSCMALLKKWWSFRRSDLPCSPKCSLVCRYGKWTLRVPVEMVHAWESETCCLAYGCTVFWYVCNFSGSRTKTFTRARFVIQINPDWTFAYRSRFDMDSSGQFSEAGFSLCCSFGLSTHEQILTESVALWHCFLGLRISTVPPDVSELQDLASDFWGNSEVVWSVGTGWFGSVSTEKLADVTCLVTPFLSLFCLAFEAQTNRRSHWSSFTNPCWWTGWRFIGRKRWPLLPWSLPLGHPLTFLPLSWIG